MEIKLDSDRLNRWLALGANVGVLVGLAVLIFELRQNHELMRAQTRHEMSMGLVSVTSMPATDNHLAGLIQRSIDGEELGPEDTSQLAFFYRSLIRTWENSYYQRKMGLYDEAEYEAVSGAWGGIITENVVVMDLWCRYRQIVSPDFRDELDSVFPLEHCNQN